ncbi:MAG TPA: type IV secretory system conjugative DNA transfer family protein [Bacilli bacterium]|nr:type IV secretory system conjugative DNA transfer family protein [Bacilli bacterium]
MKLKLGFKVTPKDLTIFAIFCVFLLYFSSIAVANIYALINDGEFYGFNPIEGLTFKYLPVTLLVFFGILIVIFFSVSSSIFEKTSGVGIVLGQHESNGYSRWFTAKEMKKAYKVFKVGVKDITAEAAGVVFINDGKDMWVDDSENHTLVIGSTGSGKTTAVVEPLIYSLIKHGESMILTDPKGELYINHGTLLKARGYKIIILNLRDPQRGNAWNPLTMPYRLYKAGNIDKATELIDDIASNIMIDKSAQDPFWGESASDYLSGCILGLIQDADEEVVNLSSISYMTTVGEDKLGNSTYIREYFRMKGEDSSVYTYAGNTINAPSETKGSILSTFRQKIRIFATRENISEMLAYSDFNMEDVGKTKTALFICVQDEKTTYHALATIFIKQCYETLIDVAQQSPGNKLPCRTNFILDEFANMPPLKDVTTMITAARSRAIRFTFIIQNYAQLDKVYGVEQAKTIRGNCANIIYILTNELAALEEISKLCGQVKTKKDDKEAARDLITISDLQKLKMNEVIILRNRLYPFRTVLKQGFGVDWGDGELKAKADFPTREPKEIALFKLKEFVDLRRKSMVPKEGPGISGGVPSFASLMAGGLGGPMGGSMGSPMGSPMGHVPSKPSFEDFMNNRAPSSKPIKPAFDVDELVKKIDAQIAKLEEEEKNENNKARGTVGTPQMNPFVQVNENKPEIISAPVEQKPIEDKKPIDFKIDSLSETMNVPTNSEKVTPIINRELPPETSVVAKPVNVYDEIKNIQPVDEDDDLEEMDVVPKTNETPIMEHPTTNINTPKTFADMINNNNQTIANASPVINVPTVDVSKLGGIVDPTVTPSNPPINPNTTVKVDTQSKVINNNSNNDDEFYDDFFEE